jgi:hypothetical protein
MTRFKPPLTKTDLAAIQERSQTPDTRALLWEIARLRSIVLRADQLQQCLGNSAGSVGIVVDALRDQLRGEPCIDERVRLDFSE